MYLISNLGTFPLISSNEIVSINKSDSDTENHPSVWRKTHDAANENNNAIFEYLDIHCH